jgi:peptide/nickel transport system substrate-binding protein
MQEGDRTGAPTAESGSRGVSRRELLRRAAWLTAGVPALLLLDACGQAPAPAAQPTAAPAKPAADVATAAPKPAVQSATATPIAAKPAGQAPAAATAPAQQPTAAPAAQKPASAGPQQNKTLRLRLFEDLLNMDPALIATGTDLIVSDLIYNRLLRRGINTGKFEPDLAESWELSPDAKTYTFKLRKGVRWHKDYGELTSADVKFSWERIQDKALAAQFAPELTPVQSIETPDPYTVVVKVKEPYPAFVETVVAYTPGLIINQKAYEDAKGKWASQPIGTGPYEFVKWTPGASVDVKANPNYFGRQQTVSDVHLVITKEDDVAELAVEKGDIDIAYVHGPEVQQRAVENRSINHDIVPGPRILHLQLNLDKAPLDNVKVRQAMQLATDKVSIVKHVLLDQAKVASTFLNPNMFSFDNEELYSYDPNKAKALLAEAGFPNGLPNPLRLLVGIESEYVAVVTAVQQQWAQVGIKVEIQSLERAVAEQRRRARDFEVLMQAIARFEPSQYLLPYVTGPAIPYPNVMGYKGADDFILKAVVEPDEAKRKEMYVQAQRKLKEDSPLVPLYYPNFMIAMRPEIEGAKADPTRIYNVRDIRFKS